MSVLEDFKRLGDKASFHFADDSTKEWGLAKVSERSATDLFDAHPELQDEMKEIAKRFLWKLNRPVAQRINSV